MKVKPKLRVFRGLYVFTNFTKTYIMSNNLYNKVKIHLAQLLAPTILAECVKKELGWKSGCRLNEILFFTFCGFKLQVLTMI